MANSLEISLFKKIGDMWIKIPVLPPDVSYGQMPYNFSDFNQNDLDTLCLYISFAGGRNNAGNIDTRTDDGNPFNIKLGSTITKPLTVAHYNFWELDILGNFVPPMLSLGDFRLTVIQYLENYSDRVLDYTIAFTMAGDKRICNIKYTNNYINSPLIVTELSIKGSSTDNLPFFFYCPDHNTSLAFPLPNGITIRGYPAFWFKEGYEIYYFEKPAHGDISKEIRNPFIWSTGSTVQLPIPVMKSGYAAVSWTRTWVSDSNIAPDMKIPIGQPYEMPPSGSLDYVKFTLNERPATGLGLNNLSRKMGFR